MNVSVIISTYRQPAWLEKVLWGYICQQQARFEVVVAEDGQDDATAEVVERMRSPAGSAISQIIHVRHEHIGFRKCMILNRAVLAASGDYLIFADGDCIPRRDLVATHIRHAKPGHFLSGGYFKLSRQASETVQIEDITSGRCFDPSWLRRYGQPWSRWMWRLRLTGGFWPKVLDRMTTTRATWNGCNASTFKEYILAVNGFDSRMRYGGEDREFGQRLVNLGLKGIQIRHRAICLHLHHDRGYATAEGIAFNRSIRDQTARCRLVRTPCGIDQLDDLAEDDRHS